MLAQTKKCLFEQINLKYMNPEKKESLLKKHLSVFSVFPLSGQQFETAFMF